MVEFNAFPQLEPKERRILPPRLESRELSDLAVFPHVDPRVAQDATAPPAMAAVWAKPRYESLRASGARVPLGLTSVDDFLTGGVAAGSTLIISGPPFGGKRALACSFLASAVASGAPALALITDGDIAQWRQSVAGLTARVPDDRKGLACFLDVFGSSEGRPGTQPMPEQILAAVANACEALPSDNRRFVLDSFSTVVAMCGFPAAFGMLLRLTALLRREGATTLVLVEAGAHSPLETQLVKRQADGAIDFRQYGGIPELQVTGLGVAGASPWLQGRTESGTVQVPARGT